MSSQTPLGAERISIPSPIFGLDDNKVVFRAKNGDDFALEYLLKKYRKVAWVKAQAYFLIGAEGEDLIQEGLIGLYKAIRDFRSDKEVSFRGFAELCITRQMITAIKTANRQKHSPLNSYISLNEPLCYDGDGPERTLSDKISGSQGIDPVELIIGGEELKSINSNFDKLLSPLEAKVLRLYLEGRSYQEIARVLKRRPKSVDNALQRIKKKIGIHLSKNNHQLSK